MFAIVQNGLIGGAHCGCSPDRISASQVAHPARVRAAGDDQPQAMPPLEAVPRSPQIDLQMQAVAAARFHAAIALCMFHWWFGRHAQQAIAHIQRFAVGLHVTQAAEEIGVP